MPGVPTSCLPGYDGQLFFFAEVSIDESNACDLPAYHD
jgi:hypothetical protein